MDADEVLRCLTEAESGRLRPELCGGRYVVVCYDAEAEYEGEEEDEYDEGPFSIRVLGEAPSLYGALDLLANEVFDLDFYANAGEAALEELEAEAEELLEDEEAGAVSELQALNSQISQIQALNSQIGTLERRLLGLMVLGHIMTMDTVTSDYWSDPYLGEAPLLFPGARFAFLTSAAPPHQEEAYAVLEIQPAGAPSPADRALMEAKDAAAIAAALAGGADVNALDGRGMSPLHHAVAHRRQDAVAALLAAGADPARQAGFGNAPHFAMLGDAGTVRAAAGIEDADHWRILRALIEAGAPVNAGDRTGMTLLDLAIATVPYPEEAIGFLLGRGARTARRASEPLTRLLQKLPYHVRADLPVRVNEVRFLLDSGAATDGALRALLGTTGYYETEVSGEILLALVEEIVRHGGRDTPDDKGRTALDQAESWLEGDRHSNYAPVVERLRALR